MLFCQNQLKTNQVRIPDTGQTADKKLIQNLTILAKRLLILLSNPEN